MKNPGRSKAAEYMASFRLRRKEGRRVFRIEIFEVEIIGTLIDRGRLTPKEALDDRRVEMALEKIVRDWAATVST